MEGMRLLRTLKLTNFLSYGPEAEEIELQPLNVLIGPNGSGKSNLIEAIGLLKAAPSDISAPIRAGGGMPQWPYKGGGTPAIDLAIETTVSYPEGTGPLRYRFQLRSVKQRMEVVDEAIQDEVVSDSDEREYCIYYEIRDGRPALNASEVVSSSESPRDTGGNLVRRFIHPDHIDPSKSILEQRKDPDVYPELTYLGNELSDIKLFRACNLGPRSPLRGPQPADLSASFLSENGGNLGIVLNYLLNRPHTKRRLLKELKRFYEYVDDMTTRIVANTVETSFDECGFAESTPSARLSDGTLLYLRLLTILCHPSPPPLVCIEEPETGLHPAVLPMVAELLIEASEKTQLIVTTHSDTLVSEFSAVPEVVVVCERDDRGSHLRRLDADRLKQWLEKYPLGELWRMGETGGNPW